MYASTSTDGGLTRSPETEVATNAGGYAEGVRCCLFGADIDTVTQTMYVAWGRTSGYFPGDYIGEAITTGRMYMVWAVSSKPPATSTSRYHQVIYGATVQL